MAEMHADELSRSSGDYPVGASFATFAAASGGFADVGNMLEHHAAIGDEATAGRSRVAQCECMASVGDMVPSAPTMAMISRPKAISTTLFRCNRAILSGSVRRGARACRLKMAMHTITRNS